MRRSGLLRLSNSSFENCSFLEEVDLTLNFIELLHKALFSSCENLKIFKASMNWIRIVPDDLFGNTKNLEVFAIDKNRIDLFPDNLLEKMTSLKIFNIQGNRITHVSNNNIKNAINLKEINLSFNEINNTAEVKELIQPHLGLKVLKLGYNKFLDFDFGFLQRFTELEEFSLGGNTNVTNIYWDFLPSSLKILELHGILDEIPAGAFDKFHNLKELSIDGAGITRLHNDTFSELKNLEVLQVKKSEIKELPSGLFSNQEKLIDLLLTWNQIEELPDGIFAPLKRLGADDYFNGLSLYSNKIKVLHSDIFGTHPFLKRLEFGLNNISKIDRRMFSKLPTNLNYVNFLLNECTSAVLTNISNIEHNPQLQWCFDNFDGITTVAPDETTSKCGINVKKSDILFIFVVNILVFLSCGW